MSTDPAATPARRTLRRRSTPNWPSYTRYASVAAIAGLAIYLVAGFANLAAAHGTEAHEIAKKRFGLAYLSGYIYWFSLPLGGWRC